MGNDKKIFKGSIWLSIVLSVSETEKVVLFGENLPHRQRKLFNDLKYYYSL